MATIRWCPIAPKMDIYQSLLKITILSRHMTPKRSDSRRSRGRWGPPLLLAPGSQEKIGFKQSNIGIYTVIYDIPSGYDKHSHGKIHQFLIGKPSISMGKFSMAMLNGIYNAHILHGAGIFIYITGWFLGQMLGLIFQHHGASGRWCI